MSILTTLTEGIVNRDLQREGSALLNKWERTGLLEGLNDNENTKSGMAVLLENQAKELLREASAMSAGDVEGFAAVAFPIVRRVFGGLIANELVSVQPMSLPSGLIFFLDFTFNSARGGFTSIDNDDLVGARGRGSIFGGMDRNASTPAVGKDLVSGIGLAGTVGEDPGGPYNLAGSGYSSATGSIVLPSNAETCEHFVATIDLDAGLTEAQKKNLQYDPDVLALADGIADGSEVHQAVILAVKKSLFTLNGVEVLDTNALHGIGITIVDADPDLDVGDGGSTRLIRRLTRVNPDDSTEILMTFVGLEADIKDASAGDNYDVGTVGGALVGNATVVFPLIDNIKAASTIGAVVGDEPWGLELGKDSGDGVHLDVIPEIDIKVDSVAVTAKTKKLKAKWTPELAQDLNAYHNLDAEVELTGILSEQIALEIDQEIMQDLIKGATAGTFYWSRSPGLFVSRTSGSEIGAASAAPDFTGTVSEWYETLLETVNDVSAQIHRKTGRGGANFIVCSPEVANILEFTSGFRASVTHDDNKGSAGAVNVGSVSNKFEIYVDPYFLRNVILVGRKGSSFLESGYVYAPYVPLQTTPTIFGADDFVPRKGVMTRYAKKMVRPDMYGLVIVQDLLG